MTYCSYYKERQFMLKGVCQWTFPKSILWEFVFICCLIWKRWPLYVLNTSHLVVLLLVLFWQATGSGSRAIPMLGDPSGISAVLMTTFQWLITPSFEQNSSSHVSIRFCHLWTVVIVTVFVPWLINTELDAALKIQTQNTELFVGLNVDVYEFRDPVQAHTWFRAVLVMVQAI
jgi:hypothetical protein